MHPIQFVCKVMQSPKTGCVQCHVPTQDSLCAIYRHKTVDVQSNAFTQHGLCAPPYADPRQSVPKAEAFTEVSKTLPSPKTVCLQGNAFTEDHVCAGKAFNHYSLCVRQCIHPKHCVCNTMHALKTVCVQSKAFTEDSQGCTLGPLHQGQKKPFSKRLWPTLCTLVCFCLHSVPPGCMCTCASIPCVLVCNGGVSVLILGTPSPTQRREQRLRVDLHLVRHGPCLKPCWGIP